MHCTCLPAARRYRQKIAHNFSSSASMCSLFKYFVLWWARFVNYSLAVPLLYYVNYLSNSLVPIWYLSWIVYFNIFSFLRGWFTDYYNVSNTVCLSFRRSFHIKRRNIELIGENKSAFIHQKLACCTRSSHWNPTVCNSSKNFPAIKNYSSSDISRV